jgi:predicted DNA-binding transcriptional regulator AlpA
LKAKKYKRKQSSSTASRRMRELKQRALENFSLDAPLTLSQTCIVTGISRSNIYRLGNDGPPYMQLQPENPRSRRIYYSPLVRKWIEQRLSGKQDMNS